MGLANAVSVNEGAKTAAEKRFAQIKDWMSERPDYGPPQRKKRKIHQSGFTETENDEEGARMRLQEAIPISARGSMVASRWTQSSKGALKSGDSTL